MAASRAGMAVIGACNFMQNALLKQSQIMPRILAPLQIVRERHRTTRPPSWFVPRHAASHKEHLTPENKEFLTELVHDRYAPTESPLKDEPWPRGEWTDKPKTFRTGVLAIKIGVVPQWTKDGKKFFTTMLQVLDNHVINYVPPEKLMTYAKGCKPRWKGRLGLAVVGALSCDPHLFTARYNGLFTKAGIPPKRKLTRFIVTPNAAIEPGTPLLATHFRVGDYVDCQAKTIGHGFQGVVKRWGMKGGPASHGATKHHRKMGSSGGGRTKSGLWKGKRMPGHMGMDWNVLKGLRIWRINTKYNVLYVHSPCLPGPTHCYVRVMDTCLPLRRRETYAASPPPMPTHYPEDTPEPLPEELFHEKLYQFTSPTITFDKDSQKS